MNSETYCTLITQYGTLNKRHISVSPESTETSIFRVLLKVILSIDLDMTTDAQDLLLKMYRSFKLFYSAAFFHGHC